MNLHFNIWWAIAGICFALVLLDVLVMCLLHEWQELRQRVDALEGKKRC